MNKLRARLKTGKACLNAWLAIPSGFSAEVMAQCGFDSVTVDMQHGVQDYQSMVQCFQAMDKCPITPLVRVPWNEPGISGIYVGPSDLGMSLGLKPLLDREEPQIFSIYDMLIKVTGKRGLFAGVHNLTGAYAARMIEMGFRFVTIGNDSGLMARAARNEIAIARKNAGAIAS